MTDETADRLLDAALVHVPFDGWSEATFRAAAADAGLDPARARALFPRGALGMAVAWHRRGDDLMAERLRKADLSALRYTEKVATAVRFRIEVIEDKEALRRSMALFALPQHAAEGARLLWGTADRIWRELGDTSDDINWYSKRAILSGIYGATVLYWLGDTSEGHAATWAFLDRRMEGVTRFEKTKAKLRENPLTGRLMELPDRVLGNIRAPSAAPRDDLPGRWTGKRHES
jgi:ubiquinone biosynthesis protein COQ9